MLSILLIEDDLIGQVKLQVMLEEMGYIPTLAGSLAEADQCLITQVPDLILSDIKLPDGSAIDFFEVTRPHCPIIFITGVPEKEWIDRILAIPFATFYVKPIHTLTLLAAIKRARNEFLNHPLHRKTEKMLEVSVHYGQKIDIPLTKVIWIEVEGNYASIHLKSQKYVQRSSLRKLIPKLDEHFIQINYACILNRSYITRVNLHENLVYIHQNDFTIGRTFRKKFIETIYKSQV